jgi:hypothetical protein
MYPDETRGSFHTRWWYFRQKNRSSPPGSSTRLGLYTLRSPAPGDTSTRRSPQVKPPSRERREEMLDGASSCPPSSLACISIQTMRRLRSGSSTMDAESLRGCSGVAGAIDT